MDLAIIPRFITKKFFPDETNQIHANILFTSILVIVAIVFWQNNHVYWSAIPHLCIFQKILNVPCPGCGVTRSVFAIAGGDVSSAWKFNPAGLFLFIYFLAQIPLRITALKFNTLEAHISHIGRIGNKCIISILFLAWMLKLTQ